MKQLFLCKAGGNSLFPLLHAFIKITKIKPETLLEYKNTPECQVTSVSILFYV